MHHLLIRLHRPHSKGIGHQLGTWVIGTREKQRGRERQKDTLAGNVCVCGVCDPCWLAQITERHLISLRKRVPIRDER